MNRKSGFLKRFAAVLPLPGFLILIIVLLLVLPDNTTSPFEPSWLLPIVNTAFLFLMPFLVAFIALRAHFLRGSISILLMGCGIFALGSFSLVAGLVIGRPGGANYTATIHNLGVLIASIFHLGSAFTLFMENPYIDEAKHRKGWMILGYSGITIFLGLITLFTLSDRIPAFFTLGAGPTLLRQLVLGITIGFFTASFLLFLRFYLQKRSGFLYWYALALGLVVIGLLAIFFQKAVGSPVGWVGRSAQYLGGVYFLLAALAALRSARERDEPIGIALASFFRKAEVHFRTLVETLGDAVVTIDRNKKVLLWNGVAERAFGYSRQEALGAKLSDLKIFDNFTGHLDPAIQPSRSTKAQQQPSRFLMEEKARRKDGSEFPVEISASAGGQDENIITFIIRDITDRKRAEESLVKSEGRFKLLSHTAERLLAAADPQKVVNELCREIMGHLDCQVFFNFLVDQNAGCLHLNTCAGIPEEEVWKIQRLDYGVAVCGCVARDGAPIVVENIFEVPSPRTELVKSYDVQAYACHPLMAEGRLIGTLSFGTKTRASFSPEDLAVMRTVTDQVATAMERIRLIKDLRKSRDELEKRVQERTEELAKSQERLQNLASQLLLAQEKERKRVAVDLHDGLLSELAAMKMLFEAKMSLLEQGNLSNLSEFKKVTDILALVMREARGIMNNLHPSVLDELGLIAAISWLTGEYEKSYPHIKVQKRFEVSEKDIEESVRVVIFRVLQEALNNFAKHGKGDRVELSLVKSVSTFAFTIRDNGRGFDVKNAQKGLGLESMRERVELSGGEFQIESAIGQGTTIRATWSI